MWFHDAVHEKGPTMLRALILFLLLPAASLAQLEGVIDVHVHCAPDSGPRSIDAFDVARLARRNGMRALLFKNHYVPTASLAYLVHQAVPGIEVYGGIALNRSVGGINPQAVEHMARTTGLLGRVVWMPTFDSEHYHRTLKPNPNFVPIARDGKLLPEVDEVLAIIARENLALATGHSAPAESMLLIRAARQKGIARIILTHPLSKEVGMSVEMQKEAAGLGAFLEYPFNATLPPSPAWGGGSSSMEAYVKAIREIGPEHCILSSDLGQPLNPVHTDGLIGFFDQLKAKGFTQAEIDIMAKRNPARLLGLD
jgi:hypothetical protein